MAKTLMGMIAKNVKADINVIALVGGAGTQVLEFMEKDLGEEDAPLHLGSGNL